MCQISNTVGKLLFDKGVWKMPVNNSLKKQIDAQTMLSDRELDVALLARTSAGRNAISGILGLSVNSVKTLLKRIDKKLGPDWQRNPSIIWPDCSEVYLGEQAAASEEKDEFENGYYHRLLSMQKMQTKGRQTSFKLLIAQSKPGRDVFHVNSAQRFWLRPILKELEAEKTIKLLAVDWNETFAPTWLPLVNRGRKEIRAADYITYSTQRILEVMNNFLQHQLEDYIQEVNDKLEEVRIAARRTDQLQIPDKLKLAAAAFAEFKP